MHVWIGGWLAFLFFWLLLPLWVAREHCCSLVLQNGFLFLQLHVLLGNHAATTNEPTQTFYTHLRSRILLLPEHTLYKEERPPTQGHTQIQLGFMRCSHANEFMSNELTFKNWRKWYYDRAEKVLTAKVRNCIGDWVL